MRTLTSLLASSTALAASLLSQAPLGTPPTPAQNPTTPAKAVLGKILFWEEQLSSNGRVACGTCHLPEFGGGDSRRQRHPGADAILGNADDTWGSPGVERRDAVGQYVSDVRFGFGEQVTGRASISNAIAPWFPEQFWDGRVNGVLTDPETLVVVIPSGASLEAQSLHPMRSEVEMARANRSWADIRQRVAQVQPLALATNLPPDVQTALANAPTYAALFTAAFGDPNVTMARIAMALATYQRTTVPNQTPWDLYAAGQTSALTASQIAGLQLYNTTALCAACHPLGLTTDLSYRALGVVPTTQDPGRGGVTGLAADMGRFKTTGVRNASLKTTFLHNGRFTSMNALINFYRGGGGSFLPRDPALQPFTLTTTEQQQLLDFLDNGLVDPRARAALPPFDRPTLVSETQLVGANLYGAATPGGGFTPEILAQMPAFLGNPEWSVGFVQAPPNGVGWFVLSLLPAPPGMQLAGVTLLARPDLYALLVPFALDANGRATLVVSLPFAPDLRGVTLYGQGLLADASNPVWSGTRGASFVLR